MFDETRINITNCILQDLVLKTGSKRFVSRLSFVVVVLDDLACSSCIGHDVRFDFLIIGRWCHCFWLVLNVGQIQEVDSRDFQVIVSFD